MVKIEIQNGKTEGSVTHDELGEILWDKTSYEKASLLTKEEIDKINVSRKNKQTYKSDCYLTPGSVRYGRDWVNSLIELSWLHYSKNEDINFWGKPWVPLDRKELYNFCWMAIEQYSPMDKNIKYIELPFDIPLEHESCKLEDGSYIRIKGFIDLVVEISPGIYEILDWKSGQRQSLFTGEEYTLGYFSRDIQLCMYRYAIKKMFPEIKTVLTSILYLRDGGLFTPPEIDSHDEYIFGVVRSHVEELKACKQPTVFSEDREDFRCKHICYFAKKKTFSDSKCDCEVIRDSVRENGIDYTTLMYHKDNYEKSNI